MNQTYKQFSPACERNREPILQQLITLFKDTKTVLEIGSGTGQHAVFFAQHLPHVKWHPSDRMQNHPSILAWREEACLSNLKQPISLDVDISEQWELPRFDAVFTANTCHIMSWETVKTMFAGISRILEPQGLLVIYGPFNYQGQFTSASNQAFHASLQDQAIHMGIRDIEDMLSLATLHNLEKVNDIDMPANNRLLVFQKTTEA